MPLSAAQPTLSQEDFDLHGFVGIRLHDASPADVAAVQRQLGPVRASLARGPDIEIRFVDKLPLSGQLRYLGLDEAGFTDDAFLVLRSKHNSYARVQIPLHEAGRHCQIVCERGLAAIPLLIPIVNLTALAAGVLPLHASAFTHAGRGVLTTGWSKGGKTETLLAFTSRSAEYIGDEWVYLSACGRRMYGIPEPIRLWDWHLADLPSYRARLSRLDRARLKSIKLAQRLAGPFTAGRLSGTAFGKATARASRLLKGQLHVDIHPERLFNGIGSLSGNLDHVIFTMSHASGTVTATPIDPLEVAQRMTFSLQFERLPLLDYYYKFRFAFPELENPLIEQAEQLQRDLLVRALVDKPAHAVYHPYPVSIPALYDTIAPLIENHRG